MRLLSRAYGIVSHAFFDVYDKQGQPYIKHCLHVARMVSVYGPREEIVGILHDLIEDCPDWSYDQLREIGFPEEILVSLELVTFPKDCDYQERIKTLSTNKLARRVKIADLKHNLDTSRLKGLREKDFERMKKYLLALDYLQKVEDEHNRK